MAPIQVGLSASESNATQFGDVSVSSNYGNNTVMWVVLGVVSLLGLLIWFKLGKGKRR